MMGKTDIELEPVILLMKDIQDFLRFDESSPEGVK